MKPDTRIVFSRHAEDMIVERGIERAWIEQTVREPESVEADPTRPGVVRAFRRVAERGGRFLRVVYAQTEDVTRIITVFFDRGKRS